MSPSGNDTGACTSQSSPCKTINYGISNMIGGDTLVIGNGQYTVNAPIKEVPSGSSGTYTTIRAESDFGVKIVVSTFSNPWDAVINLWGKSYITIQGLLVDSNLYAPAAIMSSDHIKLLRNGFSGANWLENSVSVSVGPSASYVLAEDNFSYSGARYEFLVYQSTHVVMRRNVARNDRYEGNWQAAAFANYDSDNTIWENNIAIDSDNSCCVHPTAGNRLWGGFWNENNEGWPQGTPQEHYGNIVLNYRTDYGANYDPKISMSRLIENDIYWDTNNGYQGDYWIGPMPTDITIRNLTSGGNKVHYNFGTGASIWSNLPNTITHSIFADNHEYGIAGAARGNYNAYSNNGSNYGIDNGFTSAPGSNDLTNVSIVGNVLKYLPRGPEPGTPLATGGQGGARVGAQVIWKYGVDGTLYGEPGYKVLRSPENGYGRPEDRLWPFPNEAVLKAQMASYAGGGLPGPRGFAAPGNGLYGGPRTLTSYIWEYLGSPMPSYDQMYGGQTSSSLPTVTSLTPATVVVGSGALTLGVTGTGFTNGAVVTLDGVARTTTFGSATQLSAAILASDLASAGTHTVAVVNPAGTGSGTSNGRPLTVATAATLTLSPTTWNPAAGGGTQVVAVTLTPNAGTWSASSSQPWLTLGSATGTGSGSVTLTAAATTSTATRTATATIGGTTVTVTQAAGGVTVNPATWTAPASGGALGVTVTASSAALAWTATSSQSWLTLSSATGTGSGSLTLTAAATTSSTTRTTTVTIGGNTVTVTQGAGGVIVSPTSWAAPAGGGARTVTVTASSATLAWTATSSQPWLTLNSASRTGSGSVTLTAAATTSTTTRTATVTIGGTTLKVTQSGGSVRLSRTSWNAPAAGGAATVSMTVKPTSAGWTATSNQTWLTVNPQNGTGSGAVTLTAAAKVGTSTRSATVTIGGRSVTVMQ
ncbi:MAG: BACON domain-containing carbohydrate-binding protein [Vicinamibacterales bacterium]